MIEELFTGVTSLWSNLCQPYYRFNRLHLTEKRSGAAELVVPPMMKQTRSLGGNVPVAGIRYTPPLVYNAAEFIDHGRGSFILLLLV